MAAWSPYEYLMNCWLIARGLAAEGIDPDGCLITV